MTPRHTVKLAALVASACLIVFAAMAQPAPAAPPDDHVLVYRLAQQAASAVEGGLSLEAMPLPGLEERYHACDDLIAYELPTPDEFQQCSLVYETLKKRRFGGNTERFAQWLRQQPIRPLAALKVDFLRCERAAGVALLGPADAAACSHVYERLLEVGFGGDFKRLLAWWRAQQAAAVSNPIVPSEFDRGSGMVILRGGPRGAAG